MQKGFTPIVILIGLALIIGIGYISFNRLKPQLPQNLKTSTQTSPDKDSEGNTNSIADQLYEKYPVMKEINSKRVDLGYKGLTIDEDLCKAAQIMADESERLYPEKINDSTYTSYTKKYSNTVTSKLTTNDMFVDAIKDQGKKIMIDDESLVQTFTKDNSLGESALTENLTHGCYAVSSGIIGYKPFAFFIGGIQ